eukprot:gene20758-biopygen22140
MGSGPYNSPWGARGQHIGGHIGPRGQAWGGPCVSPPPPTRPRYSLRARPT